ncbi:hypothetical protein HanRHA438_Chr11g0519291 [Helianthus annuus]|nr:hypothetical protein HanHA89_Chr11g0439621 [Helianthus annuus]KAJ0872041.1 hypothetical protein HanRHA438_Chr11g0519291 [Helianthus annuus]
MEGCKVVVSACQLVCYDDIAQMLTLLKASHLPYLRTQCAPGMTKYDYIRDYLLENLLKSDCFKKYLVIN